MEMPTNKRIVLGVSGGIAAYKSPEIVRRLRERGCEVRVVMTDAACRFITALTLQAVSGRPVRRALLDEGAEAAMGHIELARWAELILIAPTTADLMARLAHGHADDLLTATCLASTAPIAIAPAMNQQMWQAPPTRGNLERLVTNGVRVLGPGVGDQACGDVGPGRMLDPNEIVERALGLLGAGPLTGLAVLVTAGPTREAIDPVRYISNRSSGKMGYSVAAAAAESGGRVLLVSGPTALPSPAGVERVAVTTAQEMHAQVMAHAPASDIFVAAAAVADYTPAAPARSKLKKRAERMSLPLIRTADIVAAVAALPGGPFTVGFAAETDDLEANARAKLEAKSLDMIAANRVGSAVGFDREDNALRLLWAGGGVDLGRGPKPQLASDLMRIVAKRYHEKHPAQNS